MKRVKRTMTADRSTLLAAAVSCLAASVLFCLAAASVACPAPTKDRFQRLVAHHSIFCMAPNRFNSTRSGVMLVLCSLLTLGSTVWIAGVARRAYSKFLVNGGLSAVYARMLLRQLGALTSGLWWLRRLGKEPGSLTMKGVKIAVIAASLLVILSTSLGHMSIGFCYKAMSVRVTTHRLPTSTLPKWVTYDQLKQAHWMPYDTHTDGNIDQDTSVLQATVGTVLAAPFYNGVYLGLSYEASKLPPMFQASGLPVVTSVNKNTNQSIMLAYIVTHGRLLQPVPEGSIDFEVQQKLLIIHRMCRMTNGQAGVSLVGLADKMPAGDDSAGISTPTAFWSNLSSTLPYHTLHRRVIRRDPFGFSTETYDHRDPLPTVASSGPVKEQYHVEQNATHFRMWTLSPDYGIMCRTDVQPYKAVLKMSSSLSVPYMVPDLKVRVPFAQGTLRLLNATLAATQDAVRQLEAPYMLARDDIPPTSPGAAHVAMKRFNKTLKAHDDQHEGLFLEYSSCYSSTYFASFSVNDSCVSTEVDKVFHTYLKAISTLDKARWDFPPGTPPVVGGLPKDVGGERQTPEPTWDWGPIASRFIPNKVAHAFLMLLMLLSVALLILAHWLTLPSTVLGVSGMAPDTWKDPAPWMAYADAEQPPSALQGLSSLTIDQVLWQEGTRGIVFALVPQRSTGKAQVPPAGEGGHMGSGAFGSKMVFTVKEGWKLSQSSPLQGGCQASMSGAGASNGDVNGGTTAAQQGAVQV